MFTPKKNTSAFDAVNQIINVLQKNQIPSSHWKAFTEPIRLHYSTGNNVQDIGSGRKLLSVQITMIHN